MSETEVTQFLKDNGCQHLIQTFLDHQILTLVALKNLEQEDLVNDMGVSALVAKQILRKVNGTQQGPQTNSNQQLMVVPPEVQHEIEKKDMKHQYELKIIQMENDHKMKLMELKMEQLKETFDQKLKISELENKNNNTNNLPSWWNSSYGPWNPSWGYHNFAFPESILLNPHFYQLIQSWLPSPRLWTLLYRASRDGYTASQFHSRCNNSGPTITIYKSSSYLFGGYNPNTWTSSNSYQNGGGSFIFTLVNPRGNTPTVFRWKSSHGPFDHSSRHANFGGGHDIYVCDNPHANTSSYIGFPCSYEDTLGFGQATFTGAYNGWCVNEIEVFRVN
eukprot:TRINITY_DN1897_c0_g2_i12.p1 TRINITY_DN1897_c0_g2~~TRINITY_DN1897_c0_g2_i12.p1  ORF type:complete len:333 (-),score=64.61 TRINITY_DN1897_c0_g2_i12:34-1032(-)